jgi:outer membrane receptor protein involved in Fe transport
MLIPLLLLLASLEGVVTDPQGAAVSGAALSLESPDRRAAYAASTGPDGAFRFPTLADGEYLLRVDAAEFASVVRRVRAGEAVRIELPLAAVGQTITVTATGGAQGPTEVARALTSVDAADLSLRSAGRLPDALWTAPGLRIQQLAGPGSFTKIIFRGLRTTNTAVVVDGMPVRDAAGFRGDLASFFADLSPTNVSTIEVMRGAGSALYGSAAIGGVLHFVPREATADTHVAFGYEGGSLAQAVGRYHMSGSAGDRFGYSFGAARTDVNRGEDGHDIWRNTNASGHARYRVLRDAGLSGNVYLARTPRVNLNFSPFPIGPAGNELGYETGRGPVVGFVSNLDDPDDYRRSSILPASVRWDQRLHASYSYTVAYRGVASRRNFPAGPGQHPMLTAFGVFPSVADLNRFDGGDHLLDTHHSLEFGAWDRLTVGYQHERQSSTQEFRSPSFSSPPTTDRQSSHAVFFHNQLALLGRRLQIGAGGRFQTFRVENPESVPELRDLRTPAARTGDVALAYFLPGTATKLRAHGGNSFREPSLAERFQVLTLSGQRVRVGNPLIEPERAVSFDAGVDQFLWSDRVQVSASYFYTRQQSLIQSRTLFRQTNVRGGLARGLELEARARPARFLTLRLAYTYTNSDFIPAGSTSPRRQEGIPAHSYGVAATYVRGRWDGFLDVNGISNYDTTLFSPLRFVPVLTRFDGYWRAGVGAGYTHSLSDRWKMRWFGRVENVFNKLYYEDGFRSPRAVALAGLRFQR